MTKAILDTFLVESPQTHPSDRSFYNRKGEISRILLVVQGIINMKKLHSEKGGISPKPKEVFIAQSSAASP